MEVRKPSKSTYMHQSCSRYKPYDVIQVKEKSQLSLPKKIEFLFPPCRVRSLLLSKPSIIEERSTKKQILLKQEETA